MEKDKLTKGTGAMILGAVMAVVSVLIVYSVFIGEILPVGFLFLLFITIPLVVNGIAYLVYNIAVRIRGKESVIVLPVTCIVIAVITAIVGAISRANDHSFIMRGLESELLWFFVSIPSLVLAIIHFIVSYINLSRRVKG